MAKEKQSPRFDSERETRVLLEEIRSDVRTIAEQYTDIAKRLDNIERDVAILKEDMAILKAVAKEHTKQIQELKAGQERIEKKFDTIIADHEIRLKKLEVV